MIFEIVGIESFHVPVVHTSEYKSGAEFRNFGTEISLDLCRHNVIPHLVVRNSASSTVYTYKFQHCLVFLDIRAFNSTNSN